MAELTLETDPARAGCDADRLRRIDPHFDRYVEDGRLAGWLATVARDGRRRAAAGDPDAALHGEEPPPGRRRPRRRSGAGCSPRSRSPGFGLGLAVAQDAIAQKVLSTPGEYDWGGLASTAFWVDPVERITATFFTQMIPSSTYPLRSFRRPVYQALVD